MRLQVLSMNLKDALDKILENERKKRDRGTLVPTDASGLQFREKKVLAPVIKMYNEYDLKEITIFVLK